MIKTKQQLKSIFVTGYVPTQQDYEDLLDSLESQGEGLQLASIDEAIGGTSNMRVITPLLLKTYIDRLVKASVSEDGDNLNKLRTLIANLENWKNTLTNADADSIVNTYEEMKSFFASVPEGATLPTELAKRVNRSESLTTAFSGAITGTYNNNNETLLKFIDVVHTTQQTSFTLTLQNANNCNLDLRLKFFNNLILNVAVIMADGTTIAAGANIPVLSTATNVLLNISGWGGNYYVVFETVNNTLTGTRGYVSLSELQGKGINDSSLKVVASAFINSISGVVNYNAINGIIVGAYDNTPYTTGGNNGGYIVATLTGIDLAKQYSVLTQVTTVDNFNASIYVTKTLGIGSPTAEREKISFYIKNFNANTHFYFQVIQIS